MRVYTKSIVLLGLMVCMLACSRKKNTFLSRNWHAITAEYNILYNGNLALDLGKEELKVNYRDNFWQLLPVERMQVNDEIVLPDSSKNPNFAIAEEKAVKAIQKHSMLFNGREHNPQIDEAYLLLGKARYYDQRFVPALSAFNYILHKYPLSNTINEAKIWREKANMRLEFDQIALNNLKEILKQESLKEEERAQASAILAQAYINLDILDSAAVAINRAAQHIKNKDKKGRYLYIKGQLYNLLNKKDSANSAFNQIIALKRKTPRVYRIHAFISKIENLEPSPSNRVRIAQLLVKLEENRENRPFLDKIYYQLAEFHYSQDSVELAMKYYNKSLRSSENDSYLQAIDYRTLGNIYFDAANYPLAGAYYDSTLLRLPKNTREFRRINKKRENLEDVIYFENVAQKNDSILYLTGLSQNEKLEYFTDYTAHLKSETLKRLETQKAQENIPVNSAPNAFVGQTMGPPGIPNPANAFYFYNPTTVAYGRQQFFNRWGERPLADGWRTSQMAITGMQDSLKENPVETIVFENNPIYDPETYIAQIPTNREVLDSLEKERNFAYYQLGLIYKEKFEEYGLAAQKLEALLEGNVQERLVLPAKYNLFKIYNQLQLPVKAEAVKSDILYQYPNSRYAEIIKNPSGELAITQSPENRYKEIYRLYQNQKFDAVIAQSNALIETAAGQGLIPKLELLKAMAIGRLRGFKDFKKALNYVALNFPQSEEGQKAQQLYSNSLPKLADTSFTIAGNSDAFNLIFLTENSDTLEIQTIQQKIKKALEDLAYRHLELSKDVYGPQEVFVVVHGFNSPEKAREFEKMLVTNIEYLLKKEAFYISNSNYAVVQIHKNLQDYLRFINKNEKDVSTK